MYLGVQGLMPRDLRDVTSATVDRIREMGFAGAACRFFDPMEYTEAEVRRLGALMRDGGVEPCQAVAHHPDLIDPDEGRRDQGVQVMRYMCRITRWLGAGNLYLRPGSVNPRGSWYPHPDNHRPEAFETLVRSVRQVCDAAEEEGVLLAVEGHVLSILDTPQRILELIQAVDSPALRFNADPVNFIGSRAEAFDSASVTEGIFQVLGPYTVCGHAKDYYLQDRLVLHVEETVIGRGLMDQETYLRLFERWCPEGYLQIEHLPDEDLPEAREALYAAGLRAGIRWRRPGEGSGPPAQGGG